MKNAILGIPYDYTVSFNSASMAGTSAAYLSNDEPGLIWAPATAGAVEIDFYLGSPKLVSCICILGLGEATYNISVYRKDSVVANAPYIFVGTIRSNFSGDRSADRMKFFAMFDTPVLASTIALRVEASGNTSFRPWRVLICRTIQPGENISIGAEEGLDDRSIRRYARNGRRVLDPTVKVPTFQGSWPWLEDAEYQAIRKYWRQRGATKPVLLVLDPQQDSDTAYGGEDGIFYGDMEKSAKLGYEDGSYSFSFAIVSLAP